MNSARKEIRTAAEGKLHINVTINGAGVELADENEAFNLMAEVMREVRRRLRKRGIESVSYKIERSTDEGKRLERLLNSEFGQDAVTVRLHKPGDAGIIAMPMKKNVPEGGPEWRPVKCPVCGRECWERPGVLDAMKKNPKLMAACTECALKITVTRR